MANLPHPPPPPINYLIMYPLHFVSSAMIPEYTPKSRINAMLGSNQGYMMMSLSRPFSPSASRNNASIRYLLTIPSALCTSSLL